MTINDETFRKGIDALQKEFPGGKTYGGMRVKALWNECRPLTVERFEYLLYQLATKHKSLPSVEEFRAGISRVRQQEWSNPASEEHRGCGRCAGGWLIARSRDDGLTTSFRCTCPAGEMLSKRASQWNEGFGERYALERTA